MSKSIGIIWGSNRLNMELPEEEFSNLDLYADLLSTDHEREEIERQELKSKYDEVVQQNEEMKEKLIRHENQMKALMTENASLKKNMSALYQTAKLEMKRKEAEIGRLRKTMETYAKLIKGQGISVPILETSINHVKNNFNSKFNGKRKTSEIWEKQASSAKPRSDSMSDVQARLIGIAAASFPQESLEVDTEVQHTIIEPQRQEKTGHLVENWVELEKSEPDKDEQYYEKDSCNTVQNCSVDKDDILKDNKHNGAVRHNWKMENIRQDKRSSREREKLGCRPSRKERENHLPDNHQSKERIDSPLYRRNSKERDHEKHKRDLYKEDHKGKKTLLKEDSNMNRGEKFGKVRESRKQNKKEIYGKDNKRPEERKSRERKDDSLKKHGKIDKVHEKQERSIKERLTCEKEARSSANKERSRAAHNKISSREKLMDHRRRHGGSQERKHVDDTLKRIEDGGRRDNGRLRNHDVEIHDTDSVRAGNKRKLDESYKSTDRPSKKHCTVSGGNSRCRKDSRTKSDEKKRAKHSSQSKQTEIKDPKPTKLSDIDRMDHYMKRAQFLFEVRRGKKKEPLLKTGCVNPVDSNVKESNVTEGTDNISDQEMKPDAEYFGDELCQINDKPLCSMENNNSVTTPFDKLPTACNVIFNEYQNQNVTGSEIENENDHGESVPYEEGMEWNQCEDVTNIEQTPGKAEMKDDGMMSEKDDITMSGKDTNLSEASKHAGSDSMCDDTVEEITDPKNNIKAIKEAKSPLSSASQPPAVVPSINFSQVTEKSDVLEVIESSGFLELSENPNAFKVLQDSDVLEVQQNTGVLKQSTATAADVKDSVTDILQDVKEESIREKKGDLTSNAVMYSSEASGNGSVDVVELGLGEMSPSNDGETEDLGLEHEKGTMTADIESAEEGEITSESEDDSSKKRVRKDPMENRRDRSHCHRDRAKHHSVRGHSEKRQHVKHDEKKSSKRQRDERKHDSHRKDVHRNSEYHNLKHSIRDPNDEVHDIKRKDGHKTRRSNGDYLESNHSSTSRKNGREAKENLPRKPDSNGNGSNRPKKS